MWLGENFLTMIYLQASLIHCLNYLFSEKNSSNILALTVSQVNDSITIN